MDLSCILNSPESCPSGTAGVSRERPRQSSCHRPISQGEISRRTWAAIAPYNRARCSTRPAGPAPGTEVNIASSSMAKGLENSSSLHPRRLVPPHAADVRKRRSNANFKDWTLEQKLDGPRGGRVSLWTESSPSSLSMRGVGIRIGRSPARRPRGNSQDERKIEDGCVSRVSLCPPVRDRASLVFTSVDG
jgi:hypothetical protein